MTVQKENKKNVNESDRLIGLIRNLYDTLGEEYLSNTRPNEYKRTTWTRIENFNKVVDKVKELAPQLPDYTIDIPDDRKDGPSTLIHELVGYAKDMILFLDPEIKSFRDFDAEYKDQKDRGEKVSDERMVRKRTALISQLESEKEAKMNSAKIYLRTAIIAFLFIAILNIMLFTIASYRGWQPNISEFMASFLGRGIYLITIEVFVIFVAFYFLSIYKSYVKLSELYNSYKLLISADEFFKDDIDYDYRHRGDKGEDREAEFRLAYFNMRKENAQKIHNLPDRVYNLFSQKVPLKETPSTVSLLEELVKSISSLIIKKPK